jgi:4-hydroxybutyrate CoA-transferase
MSGLEGLIGSGQRVWVAGSSNEPTALVRALEQSALPEGVTFIQFPLSGFNDIDFTSLPGDPREETFFMSSALKEAAADRLDFVPMQMRAVYDHLARNVDVVLLQAARDRSGQLRVGPNMDFVEAAVSSAGTLIVEINEGFVAPCGTLSLEDVQIDGSVSSNRPLPLMPPPVIDDAAGAIGAHVAGLIRDGDCIQTGIGSIPAAIVAQLTEHNDLGLHGGLIDDGGMTLIREGNVTGVRKAVDRGCHVTGMALGSEALYDWLADTPSVLFRGANYTHEVSVIGRLDNFVSVNSAVEVDLYGQVNAEFAGGRQISGTGGSVDFMRAARASKGGRSIVAMNATARRGTISRIVPRVEMVTALRTDVDRVVTEYGVAELDGRSVSERAEALIGIAAPEFREVLRDQAPI